MDMRIEYSARQFQKKRTEDLQELEVLSAGLSNEEAIRQKIAFMNLDIVNAYLKAVAEEIDKPNPDYYKYLTKDIARIIQESQSTAVIQKSSSYHPSVDGIKRPDAYRPASGEIYQTNVLAESDWNILAAHNLLAKSDLESTERTKTSGRAIFVKTPYANQKGGFTLQSQILCCAPNLSDPLKTEEAKACIRKEKVDGFTMVMLDKEQYRLRCEAMAQSISKVSVTAKLEAIYLPRIGLGIFLNGLDSDVTFYQRTSEELSEHQMPVAVSSNAAFIYDENTPDKLYYYNKNMHIFRQAHSISDKAFQEYKTFYQSKTFDINRSCALSDRDLGQIKKWIGFTHQNKVERKHAAHIMYDSLHHALKTHGIVGTIVIFDKDPDRTTLLKEFEDWKADRDAPALNCCIGDTKNFAPCVIAGDDKSACGQLYIVVAQTWNKLPPQDEQMNQRSLGPICNTSFNPWLHPELHVNFHRHHQDQKLQATEVKHPFNLFSPPPDCTDPCVKIMPEAGM